jgi:hypothetical protein
MRAKSDRLGAAPVAESLSFQGPDRSRPSRPGRRVALLEEGPMPQNHDAGGDPPPFLQIGLPEFTRDAVVRWLFALPLEDADVCLAALTSLLEALNEREDVSRALKQDLAESIRKPALQLLDESRNRLVDALLPYAPKPLAVIRAGRKIHLNLLRAYTQSVFGTGGRTAGTDEETLSRCLFRSFQHGGQALLWTSQLYQQPAGAFWSAVYSLYRLGETRGLLQAEFADPDERQTCRTPDHQFKQVLLFYLANVRRLRQQDMLAVFEALGRFAGLAEIMPEPEGKGRTAEFLLMLASNSPPVRRPGQEPKQPGCFRFLAVGDLPQALKEAAGFGDGPLQGLDRAMLERVARSLGGQEKRRTGRLPEARSIRYVFGLEDVAASLPEQIVPDQPASRESFLPPQPAGDGFELLPLQGHVAGASQPEPKSIRSEIALIGEPGASSGLSLQRGPEDRPAPANAESAAQIWRSPPKRLDPPETFEGRLLDSGPLGFSLVWTQALSPKARVGALMGLWVEQAPYVGVIRWLETRVDGLRIGVELLAPSASPVVVADSSGRPFGRGLLLPADPVLRRLPELLAPPGVARTGSILSLPSPPNGASSFKVREVLEQTPCFARYGIVPLYNKLGPP